MFAVTLFPTLYWLTKRMQNCAEWSASVESDNMDTESLSFVRARFQLSVSWIAVNSYYLSLFFNNCMSWLYACSIGQSVRNAVYKLRALKPAKTSWIFDLKGRIIKKISTISNKQGTRWKSKLSLTFVFQFFCRQNDSYFVMSPPHVWDVYSVFYIVTFTSN